jgi:hypothetical protein
MKRFLIAFAALLASALLLYVLLAQVGRAGAQDGILALDDRIEDVVTSVDGVPQPADQADLTITVYFDKSAGLPLRSPDAHGVLFAQSDHTYLIKPGANKLVDGKFTCQPSNGGHETEILATGSTVFVEDITDFSRAQAGNDPTQLYVQQVLETVDQPAALPECASLQVWGKRQGDEIVADIIFYHDERP